MYEKYFRFAGLKQAMKKLIITMLAFLPVCSFAQFREGDSNHIGIFGGVNQFSLYTSDFEAKPGTGWNAGLSMRGGFYNDFDMVYAIQFSENNFSVEAESLGASRDVDFKLSSAQLSLLLSYKFIGNHLSVEFGPMFQVNGELTLDENDEEMILSGTDVTAKDFANISRVSFYPTIGLTAGVTHFRANVTYQYGVNNMLAKLDGGYKGHAGIITGNLIIYL